MAQSDRYRVVVSDRAVEMLVSCARFLANVSEQAAEELVTAFSEKAASLQQLPERCPWMDSAYIPKRKYRKLTLAETYLMIYQIKGDAVYIDYVLDCRQDYRWLL